MRHTCAVIGALLVSASCLAALGPETPLAPADNPSAAQLHVRLAAASGHLLAVWSDGRLRGTLDGSLLDLQIAGAPAGVIGVCGGRKNFLVAYQTDNHAAPYTSPVLALRIGFDGHVLDPAPLMVDTDTRGFWGGNVVYDGTDFIIATMEKHSYPSIMFPETVFTGRVSEDGLLTSAVRRTSASPSWQPLWPRIAATPDHLIIAYESIFWGNEGIGRFGISAMSLPPQDAGSGLRQDSEFDVTGDVPRPAVTVADGRVTLAWMNATMGGSTIDIAQTDLDGRPLVPPRIAALSTESVVDGTDVEIAWDGNVYAVAWTTGTEPWPAPLRVVRFAQNSQFWDRQPIVIADSAYPDVSLTATPDGFAVGYSRPDASTGVMRAFIRTIDRTDEPGRPRRRSVR